MLAGVVRSHYFGSPVPISVTMAVTYRCNLRCRYCQIWKEAGEEMSTRQVLCAIDELAAAGMCRLGITGGEPLLRPDIGTIVARARERGLFTTLFTNGAYVHQHLPTLKQLDAVLISFDGPREIHDAMRGKGAHANALRAISTLSSQGIKVWTNTVVTNRNIDVVDHVLEVVGSHGAHAAFQPIFEHSYSVKGERIAKLRADRQQYVGLIDRLLELKRGGAPVLNSAPSLQQLRDPDLDADRASCLASSAYGAITPDGKVAPCQVLVQSAGLPDGRKVGFAEAFKRTRRPRPCTGCFCFATIEQDLLFSLDPASIGNTVKYLAGERLRQALSSGKGQRPGEAAHGAVAEYPDCVTEACAEHPDRESEVQAAAADVEQAADLASANKAQW